MLDSWTADHVERVRTKRWALKDHQMSTERLEQREEIKSAYRRIPEEELPVGNLKINNALIIYILDRWTGGVWGADQLKAGYLWESIVSAILQISVVICDS